MMNGTIENLARAHRLAGLIEPGYVWINHTGSHIAGAEFGGYKKSGLDREEGLPGLFADTQNKNVHMVLN